MTDVVICNKAHYHQVAVSTAVTIAGQNYQKVAAL